MISCPKCTRSIPDTAKYCPYCQAEVIVSESMISDSKKLNKSKRKRIFMLLLIIIILLIILAALAIWIYLRSDFRVEQELQNGNYSQAVALINNNEDIEENDEILDATKESLEQIYQSYLNEEATYDKTIQQIDIFAEANSSIIQSLAADYRERVDLLHNSRQAYEAAEAAYAVQDYTNALTNYYMVGAEDERYYALVQDKIQVVTQEYKQSELDAAKKYADQRLYAQAIERLTGTEAVFQSDSEYVDQCETLRIEYIADWVDAQREKKLYFSGDKNIEGAVYIACLYNLSELDPDFDLEGLIEEGTSYEEEMLCVRINAQRRKMGYDALERNASFADVAGAVSAYGIKKARDEEDLSSFHVNDTYLIGKLDSLFPAWNNVKHTALIGYSSAKNIFEGDDTFYGNKDKLPSEYKNQAKYQENPYLAYGEFQKDKMKYLGVGMEFDQETMQCYWVVLTGY